jgi:hypothetical protein
MRELCFAFDLPMIFMGNGPRSRVRLGDGHPVSRQIGSSSQVKTKPAYAFDFGREIDFRGLSRFIQGLTQETDSVLEDVQQLLLSSHRPAIAELSGLDSVAAIIQAAERLSLDVILPTIVLTGRVWQPSVCKEAL